MSNVKSKMCSFESQGQLFFKAGLVYVPVPRDQPEKKSIFFYIQKKNVRCVQKKAKL